MSVHLKELISLPVFKEHFQQLMASSLSSGLTDGITSGITFVLGQSGLCAVDGSAAGSTVGRLVGLQVSGTVSSPLFSWVVLGQGPLQPPWLRP